MKNQTIEVMKALSIIGIVLLHAIFIYYGENTEWSNLLRLVCIQTLLVLSGFVMYGKISNKWVQEKVIRRVPLLVIFTLVYWLFYSFVVGVDGGETIQANLGNYYGYALLSGFDGTVLWYIWQLVACTALLLLFESVSRLFPRIPYLLKFAIFVGIIVVFPLDIIGFRYIKWYGLFIFGGYALRYASNMVSHKLAWLGLLLPFSLLLDLTYQGQSIVGMLIYWEQLVTERLFIS